MAQFNLTNAIDGRSPDQVNVPNDQFHMMAEHWQICQDLMKGTRHIREQGSLYLPREELEWTADYDRRRNRSTLSPFFKTAIEVSLSRPFEKSVTFFEDKTQDPIFEYREDIDLMGNDITSFAYQVAEDAFVNGLTHILTDYPTVDGTPRTLADERALGIRPYLVHLKADKVIGWKHTTRNGRPMLTQVRYVTHKTRDVGRFGSEVVPTIRVLEPGVVMEYQKNENGDWRLVSELPMLDRNGVPLTRIPITTYYTNRKGYMYALPPYEDIAHLNIKHYQAQSDQDNILHAARMPILFGTGLSDGINEQDDVEIAANRLISARQGATLSYVEHSGAAISAGRQQLLDIKDEITALSIMGQFGHPGGVTATARVLDESKQDTILKARTRLLKQALDEALQKMAWFDVNLNPEEQVASVNLNTDFGMTVKQEQDIQHLITLRQTGEITSTTLLNEIQRRGLLSDDMDIEAEVELAGEVSIGEQRMDLEAQ